MEVGYAARRQVKAPLSTPRQLLGKKAYEKKGRHDFIKKVKKKNKNKKQVLSGALTNALVDEAAFRRAGFFPLPPPCRVQLKAAPQPQSLICCC